MKIDQAADMLDKQLRFLGFPIVSVGIGDRTLIVYLEKYDKRIEDYTSPLSRFMDCQVKYSICDKIKPC